MKSNRSKNRQQKQLLLVEYEIRISAVKQKNTEFVKNSRYFNLYFVFFWILYKKEKRRFLSQKRIGSQVQPKYVANAHYSIGEEFENFRILKQVEIPVLKPV